jgi:hypothetical protein
VTQLRLPVGSGRLRSKPASSARLVNCYAEQLPAGAKTPIIVQRTDGVVELDLDGQSVGTGPIYGMIAALDPADGLFVVSGAELYRVSPRNGSVSLLGNIGSGASIQNVSMAINTTSVVVVNNPRAYHYTLLTGVFGQITDADFLGAGDVKFLSNYLLFREPDAGIFFGADFGSATSFDALAFATAETAPDNLVGLEADHVQALLFGSDSIEIWDNDPSAGSFPFRRAANGFVELGCLNGRTIAKLDNSVFWLASDYTIRRLSGATPQRVSDHAFEQFLASIEVASASAYAYSRGGHLFYVLTCNQGTWVHDVTTGEPHERQTYGRDFWRWSTTRCTTAGSTSATSRATRSGISTPRPTTSSATRCAWNGLISRSTPSRSVRFIAVSRSSAKPASGSRTARARILRSC